MRAATYVVNCCRFRSPVVILDVAHNPAAFKVLFQHLQNHLHRHSSRRCARLHIIIGFSGDKCVAEVFRQIVALATEMGVNASTSPPMRMMIHPVRSSSSVRASPVSTLQQQWENVVKEMPAAGISLSPSSPSPSPSPSSSPSPSPSPSPAPSPSPSPSSSALDAVSWQCVNNGDVSATVRKVLNSARCSDESALAGDGDDVVMICGSLYIMNETRIALGLNHVTDHVDLNEYITK